MSVKIIGNGIVGTNMAKLFPEAYIHDPPKGHICNIKTDIAIICVPTEMKSDGSADISIVEKVIMENEADVFFIKSAVPPGTTDMLIKKYGKRICVSPEYFGSTIHANNVDYDFLIIGGQKKDCNVIIKEYKKIKHPNFKIYITSTKTAELCKYMENTWLAFKVTFCNEFYRIAQHCEVDYNELRELWLADPRINRSHTFVYEDKPFYDSHCLNKDIPAIIAFCETIKYNPTLLRQMHLTNKRFKGEKSCQ